jgi:branched-chain amino acid aminotransferase
VYRGESVKVQDEQTGPLARKLYREIIDIQYGRKEDTHGWVEPV